jgi:hypothetical protein
MLLRALLRALLWLGERVGGWAGHMPEFVLR